MSKSKGDDDDKEKNMWDGSAEGLEDFNKKIARWSRKKLGTTFGNHFWQDTLPDMDAMTSGADWNDYCEDVWECINETDPAKAKVLYDLTSGFWSQGWHVKWRRGQYDRIYDKVEASVKDMAALEVEALGMENAKDLRKHLFKQFGGAGDDIRAREEIYEAGMPATKDSPAFPSGVHMINKLRVLQAERVALLKLCTKDKRDTYEYGTEPKLVKIVLRHLRGSDYQETIEKLLQEVKLRKEFESKLPTVDQYGVMSMPVVTDSVISEDWEFRNFSNDWLPSWTELKSKLVSKYKSAGFGKKKSGQEKGATLPVMYVPGLGSSPNLRCFGCGEYGHRKADPSCKAGKDEWHESAPKKWQANKKPRFGGKGKGKGKGKSGVDGMRGIREKSGVCFEYQKTGKCRFGPNCRYSHDGGGASHVGVNLTKKQRKSITIAAVKELKKEIKKKAEKDGKGVDDTDLQDYLKSFMMIKATPRSYRGQIVINVPVMQADLVDMSTDVCWDSGSAMGITTDPDDMVSIDTSESAQQSVMLRGPSVGTPGCKGRGTLVYRCSIGGVPYGLIHPLGVLADGDDVRFRIGSERQMKKRGIRVIAGKFAEVDKLECVRSGTTIDLEDKDNILVFETKGKANEINDSPRFRTLVEEIESGVRSPLVNLTEFLEKGKGGERVNKIAPDSFFSKSLLATTQTTRVVSCMLMNEAKLTRVERSRLWCRRLAYCSTDMFPRMASMPEYGDMPDICQLNEDNLVGDLAKFKRSKYAKNDPEVTMDCPPWWRVMCDGYGGQQSLGGESYEGAVGGYVFACVSTGSTDTKLYASHKQFPVALQQFLTRVEAEHFTCHCIYVDTFSVNLSEEAEGVCALYNCLIVPVSAGSPQEMAFAESRVRVIKQMSTAMLAGAPHLPPDSWACADKYAVYLSDFLPQSTRSHHCPYYLRTGRAVPWKILAIHNFGAPCLYSPMDGPIHKRAPVAEEGYFHGIQWPAVLVRRKSDMKIMNVSRKKIRVFEKAYLCELDQRAQHHGEVNPDLEEVGEFEVNTTDEIVEDAGKWESSGGEDFTPGLRPELNKNMVQSIKSLREHSFEQLQPKVTTAIEESAIRMSDLGGEGVYVDETLSKNSVDQLTELLSQAKGAAQGIEKMNMRETILKKLESLTEEMNGGVKKGQLKVGKKKKSKGTISTDNIISGKRKVETSNPEETGHKHKLMRGDRVSIPSTAFDGDDPGSYSSSHPDRCFGHVLKRENKFLVTVKWEEGGKGDLVRMKDLKLESRKANVSALIATLSDQSKQSAEATSARSDKSDWPKDFFEVLIRKDWRAWVEALKKELTGWDVNKAVTVVEIGDLPPNAKVVPLGELYTVKRDGRFKFRQYLMGNLLREGVDYGETFSTTVSNSGILIFFSLATTCEQEVWGWDAVCGYLQCKEQYDIYAFLPSHHDYSSLEYEEIALLRQQFIQLVKDEGVEGLKKFAREHKRDGRKNPKHVYKCNSSIYGAPSAGHEFEMLMHSVHTKVCGLSQTQPEPSLYCRIVVDNEGTVTGYLIVAIFVDDVRFFGTVPEKDKYMSEVMGKMKITIEKPPIAEFVSIEIHQDLKTRTCELKMPAYWKKAAVGYGHLFKFGLKERSIPLTSYDEKLLKDEPTDEEIKEAKYLPYAPLLGVMTYPASNCKFEIKLAISKLGSRRNGFSKKHFEVVLRVFEYAVATCEIGLMFSKGLDPHGDNVLWASADSSLEVPRPYGCRIVMFNGAAVSFKAKKHTMTAPSSCWAECTEFANATFDVVGCRNLLSELGFVQTEPTPIDQDNQAAQAIMNNRGSMGPTSRAMSLKVLSSRNHIEDHEVTTKDTRTDLMVADMGTKALGANPFIRYRDIMNGYSLVKAAYPDKQLSEHVYDGGSEKGLKAMQVQVMLCCPCVPLPSCSSF